MHWPGDRSFDPNIWRRFNIFLEHNFNLSPIARDDFISLGFALLMTEGMFCPEATEKR